MIVGKLWRAVMAQFNKMANWFSGQDPVAQLQYEYDRAVEELKSGREGLAQYRALVERVSRQVDENRKHVAMLEAKIKAYLKANDRESAARFALELQKARQELAENERQLAQHETAYGNHLMKIKHATGKLKELQDRIHKYDAELKMSRAEAEVAELSRTFNFDVTTDFGQIENQIQTRIDQNRAKVRVATDLSGEGLEEVQREIAMEKELGESALQEFEQEQGLAPQTPTTQTQSQTTKQL